MRIQRVSTKLNAVNPYSAAAEMAAAAQRAADVRRRLIKSVEGVDGAPRPDEVVAVGRLLNNEEKGEAEYRTATAGRGADFG